MTCDLCVCAESTVNQCLNSVFKQVPADVVEEEEYPQSSRRRNSGAHEGNYQRESSPEPKQTYAPRIDEGILRNKKKITTEIYSAV